MKVLLIKPNASIDTVIPPIGLGYLAKFVAPKHDVKIIDCQLVKISKQKCIDLFLDHMPDIIGFQVYNNDKGLVSNYLKGIKKEKEATITVIGGPYPSCEPENVFDFFGNNLDFAFRGEAEIGFLKLIEKVGINHNNIDFSDIEGLVWRKNRSIAINEPSFSNSLDHIGAPAWDLLLPNAYPPSSIGAFLKDYPVAPISVSRGCRYKCNFCAGWKITGRTVRYRSVSNVIDELKLLKHDYFINEIHILDENFAYDKNYVTEFCKAVIDENLNLKFACPNGMRVNSVDPQLLGLMKKAGFYIWHMGIESGSPRSLKMMNKTLSLSLIKNKAAEIKNAGLELAGYFIIGYYGETIEDLNKTLKLALELPLTRAMFMTFLPIPGTEIYDVLINNGHLNKHEPGKGNFYKINYAPSSLSPLRLKLFQLKAFLCFYLRPKVFYHGLKSVYNFGHLVYLMRRVFRILFNM